MRILNSDDLARARLGPVFDARHPRPGRGTNVEPPRIPVSSGGLGGSAGREQTGSMSVRAELALSTLITTYADIHQLEPEKIKFY